LAIDTVSGGTCGVIEVTQAIICVES
jgi:hypothetical protein